MRKIDLKEILETQQRIQPYIRKTECRVSRSCSARAGIEVYLKYENQQKTGSFKTRGAINKVHSLTPEERQHGLIAASAGNHAQGVAYAGKIFSAPVKIVMPETAPIVKLKATQSYGAEVILHGTMVDEAMEHARKLEKEKGYTFIHPYEDPLIIAGQASVGVEILEQVPDLDSIFVSIGGGGLISGIASYVKAKNPKCKIIGVQAENVSNMARSFHQGHLVKDLIIGPTIADGIAVKKPSAAILEDYLLPLVDDVVTVSEDEMAEAMVYILERCKNVVEACSAAALAAIFKGHPQMGKRTCAVMSGGNVDLNVISKVIDLGLTQRGRIVKLEVLIADRPGSLSAITKCIAEQKANVLEVHHNRHESGLHINETHIEFVLETFSHEHIESIKNEIRKIGARVK